MTFRANPVIAAVIANLTTAGLKVGDGEKPTDQPVGWDGAAGVRPFIGYCVVYPFRKAFDGSIDDPFDDGSPTVSVNSYGETREQATMIADAVFTSLTSTPMPITGRSVMLVEPLDDGATDRLDDVQPPMWQDVQRFRIHTTAG